MKATPQTETRERLIQLPRTSPRSEQLVFLKLLTRVDAAASNGFGFEGSVLKPGARVSESALWPTPQHPRVPVLLEYAGAANDSGEKLFVLWRYERGAFVEIARAVGLSWEWAVELRGPAVAAMAQKGPASRAMDEHDEEARAARRAWAARPRRNEGNSKLSPEIVRAIRAAYATGEVTQRELAEAHGITGVAISHLVAGRRWGWV